MKSSWLEQTIPSTNTCVIGTAERARLIDQPEPLHEREVRRHLMLSHHLSEALGGAVPATLVDLTTVRTALDVACGTGGWVLDLACAFPHIQITGIDASAQHIASAQRLAREGGFCNVTFLAQDTHKLHEGSLPGAPFDLIHLDFLASLLLTMDYPALLRVVRQLCQHGGSVCWTETEFPITNSPALERLITLTCDALDLAGHRFASPSMQKLTGICDAEQHAAHRHLGMIPRLASWLRAAGYQQVQQVSTAIEISAGMEAHPCFALQVEAFVQHIRSFLLEQGVVTAGAYEQLCVQVEAEVQQDSFCGLCFLLSVLAQTPAPENAAHL